MENYKTLLEDYKEILYSRKYIMFMDIKTKYYQDIRSFQISPQIKCHASKKFKVLMESEELLVIFLQKLTAENRQNKVEVEGQNVMAWSKSLVL